MRTVLCFKKMGPTTPLCVVDHSTTSSTEALGPTTALHAALFFLNLQFTRSLLANEVLSTLGRTRLTGRCWLGNLEAVKAFFVIIPNSYLHRPWGIDYKALDIRHRPWRIGHKA